MRLAFSVMYQLSAGKAVLSGGGKLMLHLGFTGRGHIGSIKVKR